MRVPIYNRRAGVLDNAMRSGIGTPEVAALPPIPTPTHYQPFDGDLLGYGSASAGTGRLWEAPNSNTWVSGSLAGKQAIHVDGPSVQWLSASGTNIPPETNQSFTMGMHVQIPPGDFVFLFSAFANGGQSYFEVDGYDTSTSLYFAANRSVGSPTWATDYSFSSDALGSDWQDIVVVIDRVANTITAYRNGVQMGAPFSISFMGTSNAWDRATWSIVATAGSRIAAVSTIRKTASFAEYAWWDGTALTATDANTIHQLRLRGTSIRSFLGL